MRCTRAPPTMCRKLIMITWRHCPTLLRIHVGRHRYAIELHRFHLDQTTRRLGAELAVPNVGAEHQVEMRTGALLHEIEVRKRAEAELKERERQLTTLIANLPGLAYRCRNDADYTVEFISDGVEKMTGYSAEDFIQHRQQPAALIHPDGRNRVWDEIQNALQSNHPYELQGETGTLEFEIIGLKGTRRWLETHAAPMRDTNGKVTNLLGITRDITARKQADAQLRLAAKVFEQSGEAFIIADANKEIVMVNSAFTAITGYTQAEALGKNPRLLYSGNQNEDFYRAMWKSIDTQGYWQGEMLDRRKDGSLFPKWLSISRVLDGQGQVLDEMQFPPQYLELELTEGVAMDDPLGAIAIMDNLHQRGVRMSIDDFGTGYSSLNYLKRFKVYKLKIDQSFVRDITDDPEDKAIVVAIISLAASLGLRTIAEGVETAGQSACLREQGCNEMQGYYLSKPLPPGQFENFMRACLDWP